MRARIHSKIQRTFSAIRRLFTHRGRMHPPEHLVKMVGGGDFKAVGEEFFSYFTSQCHLKPEEKILDVGSGCGRMAVPLISYVSGSGGYWGFDVSRAGVRWCIRKIGRKNSRFHFTHANINNRFYNPEGTVAARDFRFPYEDDFFDFVFLTSVFTHMPAPDMEHYLQEILRVLKPGARTMLTFFLLNDDSRRLMQNGKSIYVFSHKGQDCYSTRSDVPESAIAYDESFVRDCIVRTGLIIEEPVRFGSWCGRKNFHSSQDIMIAVKPGLG